MPRKVLLQLDCDPHPSTFDAIVAIDAGVDVLLRHGGVTPDSCVPLVHGAMFTRGGDDLASTAIFVGGSDVTAAEAITDRVRAAFFGPVRVGVMLDPSGANTTAAAAVLAAERHLPLETGAAPPRRAVVLGGTGAVGQRVARLLLRKGCRVTIVSRSRARADAVVGRIAAQTGLGAAALAAVEAHGTCAPGSALAAVLADAEVIVSAGAAGATLLDAAGRATAAAARVLIDLNAVPPAGIEGLMMGDKGRADGKSFVYGALGIGGLKMRIHRAGIGRIFATPAEFLDAEQLLGLGAALPGATRER